MRHREDVFSVSRVFSTSCAGRRRMVGRYRQTQIRHVGRHLARAARSSGRRLSDDDASHRIAVGAYRYATDRGMQKSLLPSHETAHVRSEPDRAGLDEMIRPLRHCPPRTAWACASRHVQFDAEREVATVVGSAPGRSDRQASSGQGRLAAVRAALARKDSGAYVGRVTLTCPWNPSRLRVPPGGPCIIAALICHSPFALDSHIRDRPDTAPAMCFLGGARFRYSKAIAGRGVC